MLKTKNKQCMPRIIGRRAIHVAMAEMILVVVGIAAAFAVAGWLWGFWGAESTAKAESIYIYHDSYYNYSDKVIYLHLKTNIKPKTIITSISVNGADVTRIELGDIVAGNVMQDSGGQIVASPGSDFIIKIYINKSFQPGTFVSGKIFTENGFVYNWEIVSKR